MFTKQFGKQLTIRKISITLATLITVAVFAMASSPAGGDSTIVNPTASDSAKDVAMEKKLDEIEKSDSLANETFKNLNKEILENSRKQSKKKTTGKQAP